MGFRLVQCQAGITLVYLVNELVFTAVIRIELQKNRLVICWKPVDWLASPIA